MKTIAGLIICLLVGVGCSSTGANIDMNRGYEAYLSQATHAPLIDIEAAEGQVLEWTIKGAKHIKINTLVMPKSIMPKDPTTAQQVASGAFSVLKWGIGGYYSSKILSEAFAVPKTVDPVIVSPEVIEVPYPVSIP